MLVSVASRDEQTAPPSQTPHGAKSDEAGLAPGSTVGSYVVLRTIGDGGSSRVYLAQHALIGRRVAIKVLDERIARSRAAVMRFLREARTVNLIRHPNIVDVHDVGELPDGRCYCVMELVEGETLRELVGREGRRAAAETVDLLAPVCEALAAAHTAGVIHRDVKPSNVITVGHAAPRTVKLLDFGVAKLMDPSAPGLTREGQWLGTPLTMAPEQFLGHAVDARTDVYGLGVTLFYLLTARYPYEAAQASDLAWRHVTMPPPRPSSVAPVAPALDEVVLRALAKDPDDRFSDVHDFLDALRGAVAGRRRSSSEHLSDTPGVGVFVELVLDPPTGRDYTTDELDDLDDARAQLVALLERDHLRVALHAGNCAVFLGLDPDRSLAARIHHRLTTLADNRQGNPCRLRWHIATSTARVDEEGTIGGELSRLGWVPERPLAPGHDEGEDTTLRAR